MKRTIKHIAFTLIFAALCAILFYSYKSTIWQTTIAIEKNQKWVKTDSRWRVQNEMDFPNNAAVSLYRNFYASECRQMLNLDAGEKKNNEELYLFFATKNQSVRAYLISGNQKELIYSFGENGRHFVGSESGSACHLFPIPDACEKDTTVCIEILPSFSTTNLKLLQFIYKARSPQIPEFYCGTKNGCIKSFIDQCIPQLIPVVIILFLGILSMIMYLHTLFRKKKDIKEFRYWGFLALICAVGFFMESDFAMLVFTNSFLISFISITAVAFYPRLFIHYMQECRPSFGDDFFSDIFCFITPVNISLICFSAAYKVFPFSWIIIFTKCIIILFIIFTVFQTTYRFVKSGIKISSMDIAIIIGSVSIVADIVISFVNPYASDLWRFTRYGMCAFFIVTAVLVFNEVADSEQLRTRSQMMEKYAFRDITTGLKNVVALWRDSRIFTEDSSGFYIVIFSIANMAEVINLNEFSDRDTIIKKTAEVIRETFPLKNLYRSGTLKFCMVLSAIEQQNLFSQLEDFKSAVAKFNQDFQLEHPVQIKVHMSGYKPGKNEDFEELYLKTLNEPSLI